MGLTAMPVSPRVRSWPGREHATREGGQAARLVEKCCAVLSNLADTHSHTPCAPAIRDNRQPRHHSPTSTGPMRRPTLVFAPLLAAFLAPAARAADKIDFQRDVRPILADNCLTCHGPDDGSRKGKLRLDVRDDALKGGRSKLPAIVPGKPDQSEMLKRLVSADATEMMPPPKSGKKLTPQQTQILRRWIAAGANYQ